LCNHWRAIRSDLYYKDYPLFWHVDISCYSRVHVDGHDIMDRYHWPQIFKIWIDIAVTGFPEPVTQTREFFALSRDIAL
jgi:hypothetical protein